MLNLKLFSRTNKRHFLAELIFSIPFSLGFAGVVALFGTVAFLFKIAFDLGDRGSILALAFYWLIISIVGFAGMNFLSRSRPIPAVVLLVAAVLMQVLSGFAVLFVVPVSFLLACVISTVLLQLFGQKILRKLGFSA